MVDLLGSEFFERGGYHRIATIGSRLS